MSVKVIINGEIKELPRDSTHSDLVQAAYPDIPVEEEINYIADCRAHGKSPIYEVHHPESDPVAKYDHLKSIMTSRQMEINVTRI